MKNAFDSRLGYTALLAVFCLTWSATFIVGKIAVTTAPPELFLGLRFLGGSAMLLAWAAWRGQLRHGADIPWLKLIVLGLINQAGYNGFAWIGIQTVSSGLATVISSTNPLLIGILAVPVLHDRLTPRRVIGLLLGIAGTVFLVRNRIHVAGEDVLGILYIVGGVLSMVAGSLLFKVWAPKVPLTVITGVQFAASGITLMAVGLATESVHGIVPGLAFWLTLAFTAIVSTLGGNILWFQLLQKGSAVSASSLHFLMPPLGLLMAWAALGERVTLADLLAALPIGVGIWLVTHPRAAWNPRGKSGSIPFLGFPSPNTHPSLGSPRRPYV